MNTTNLRISPLLARFHRLVVECVQCKDTWMSSFANITNSVLKKGFMKM